MLFTSEKEAAKNGCIITGNDADWEDVSTGDCETDGFEHSNYDENGEL